VYQHGSKAGTRLLFNLDSCSTMTILGSTVYIVDSMSAFGAIPMHLQKDHITYLISSANKCIEGTPGFAFVISEKKHLLTCQGILSNLSCCIGDLLKLGNARSLVLDLYDQYTYMEQSRQFRFTRTSNRAGWSLDGSASRLAPTHSILAFKRALDELEKEGGVDGRAQRFEPWLDQYRCISFLQISK
jgi:2-aminoethylphosphonate-pyruvate transaminase